MKRIVFVIILFMTLSSCTSVEVKNEATSLSRNQFGYVDFKQALQSGKLVVAKFGLEICTGCIEANKILMSLMPLYDQAIYFSTVDLMEDREAEDKYHLTVMPTIIFFDKGGKEFHRIEGLVTKEAIVKKLDDICWSN